MLGRATGAVLLGIDARLVEVEADLAGGLPSVAAVGLPDAAVREGIERIRTALSHAGFQPPRRRLLINLAPAEVPKQGTSLDLPIAVAILAADGQLPPTAAGDFVLAGELALDGSLRPIRGALSIAFEAQRAGRQRVVVPLDNRDEASLVDGVETIAASSLADAVAVLRGSRPPLASGTRGVRFMRPAGGPAGPDLSDVRGQAAARRAVEVAAAGGHHLLLTGPPGAGKSMLARRLPGIMPPPSTHEAIEITKVWSAAGMCRGLMPERPFRAPHHGISFAGIAGGGASLRPGEMSLAHHGVLFLDEFPEFRRDVLEALRQPLEDGTITVARARATATFPCRFLLVASMNPCKCGYLGAPGGRCECSRPELRRYWQKLSGPLLDRFDLLIEVPPVDLFSIAATARGEPTATVRARVEFARAAQRSRFGSLGPTCNAAMGPADLERHAALDAKARELLVSASVRLGLSARGYDRIRRVARTLADLEGSASIEESHVAEAIQYRRGLDRRLP